MYVESNSDNFNLQYITALQMFRVWNFASMEIIKHNHKIHNIQHIHSPLLWIKKCFKHKTAKIQEIFFINHYLLTNVYVSVTASWWPAYAHVSLTHGNGWYCGLFPDILHCAVYLLPLLRMSEKSPQVQVVQVYVPIIFSDG